MDLKFSKIRRVAEELIIKGGKFSKSVCWQCGGRAPAEPTILTH